MQLQMAYKGLQLCRRSSLDTAIGTVRTLSTKPLDETYDGSDGGGPSRNFKPINLSYRALEWRGKEQREKETRNKTPLLIHHSLYGRKENWNPISEIINRTTQRKVINVDGRNHGESPFTKEMSLPLMAKDIVHLMKQLKEDKMSYLGHSMGGRIGILLALTQPQLIDRMIVVDSSVIVNENSRRRWSALRQACSSLMKIEDKLNAAHGWDRLAIANKAIENLIVNKTERANFLSNLILSEKPKGKNLWRVNMSSFLANPEMMSQSPATTLENMTFEGPTLFINGQHSKFASRDHEMEIRRFFPNANFAWIKDTGHLIHVDQQKLFCEKVITFLEDTHEH